MGLRIISTRYLADGDTPRQPDDYRGRIIKYIPADVVTAWIAAIALIGAAGISSKSTIYWICFVVATAFAAGLTWKNTNTPGKPRATTQILIATVAFVIWAIALGEPFTTLFGKNNQSLFGGLLLIFFTLATGLIVPKES